MVPIRSMYAAKSSTIEIISISTFYLKKQASVLMKMYISAAYSGTALCSQCM